MGTSIAPVSPKTQGFEIKPVIVFDKMVEICKCIWSKPAITLLLIFIHGQTCKNMVKHAKTCQNI